MNAPVHNLFQGGIAILVALSITLLAAACSDSGTAVSPTSTPVSDLPTLTPTAPDSPTDDRAPEPTFTPTLTVASDPTSPPTQQIQTELPTEPPANTPKELTCVSPPAAKVNVAVDPRQPEVGDMVQVRASAEGQGGVPQYQLILAYEGDPVFEFESPSYQSPGSMLSDEVRWDLRAVSPGRASLRISVNYEHTSQCSDGSVVHSFTYASSPDVPALVTAGIPEGPTFTPIPASTLPVPGDADIQTACVLFDGAVSRTESDEYVQITNHGGSDQDLTGWILRDRDDLNQSFTFPGFILEPMATIRVYTNEVHPEWRSLSFGRGSPIWNNTQADSAALLDQEGRLVFAQTYDVDAPPGCDS